MEAVMNRIPAVRILIIISMSVFLFFSSSSRLPAQETVQPSVPLEGLLQESVANNRGLEAAREELQAAKHRVPQSSALPDPVAGYAVMGPMLETPLRSEVRRVGKESRSRWSPHH